EPNIRTAEIQAIADRLAFARDNIGAHRSRRLDKAERDSLGEHRDEKRALCLAARGHVRKIAEIAEEIRALHNNAGSFIVDKSAEILGCEDIGWKHQSLFTGHLRIGAHGLGVMRMESPRYDD